MFEHLSVINDSLFFQINNGLHSSFADVAIGYATYLGNGYITYGIVLAAILLVDRRHLLRNFLAIAALGIVEGLLLQLGKQLWDTPRPLLAFAGLIKMHQVTVYVMFEPLYEHAFPSGHTQTAFCCATFLMWLLKKSDLSLGVKRACTIFCYIVAFDVALSRIYVGAHFPVDVLGGMVLGVLPAIAVMSYLDRREAKKLTSSQS